MGKNICLYDTENRYHNTGQEHALYTPHYDPAEYAEREDCEWMNKQWTKTGENPSYETDEAQFFEDLCAFDKTNEEQRIQKGHRRPLDGYVITGKLGRWTGKHTIYPHFCCSLRDAIRTCNGGDDFRVDIKDGVITCCGYHHDGTNVFQIRGVGTSRMTECQVGQLKDIGTVGTVPDDDLFKTERHIRKIPFLTAMGFKIRRLTETKEAG